MLVLLLSDLLHMVLYHSMNDWLKVFYFKRRKPMYVLVFVCNVFCSLLLINQYYPVLLSSHCQAGGFD